MLLGLGGLTTDGGLGGLTIDVGLLFFFPPPNIPFSILSFVLNIFLPKSNARSIVLFFLDKVSFLLSLLINSI